MSDLTQLRDGKLSPVTFAEKVAGEFKDNPLVKAFAPMMLSGLQYELATTLKSPTLAAIIVSSIARVLAGQPPSLTDAVTGAVGAILKPAAAANPSH